MEEHLFFQSNVDLGVATAKCYRINGRMSLEERDIIQDALKVYRSTVYNETTCSSIIKENQEYLLSKIDTLIKKFNTMEWE